MRNINVFAKKMARNGLKIANSLGCAFHFESEFKVRKILQFPEPPPPKGGLFTAVSWVYHAHVLTSRGLYIWPIVHVSSQISNKLVVLVNVLGNVHTFRYKYLAYYIPKTEIIWNFVNFVTSNEIWLWQTDFIIASKYNMFMLTIQLWHMPLPNTRGPYSKSLVSG